jgi:hypothetical protein
MWLNQLKIAVVTQDMEQLNALLNDIPLLENPEEVKEALFLLKEATEVFTKLKSETEISMQQLKKNIDFLRSTEAPAINKLDITS